MKYIQSRIYSSRTYFLMLTFLMVAGLMLVRYEGLIGEIISTNPFKSFWMNVFFINWTFMGDGFFMIAVTGVMFFYFRNKQKGYAFLYAFLITGCSIQGLKNLVNDAAPQLFFEAGTYLNFIDVENLPGSAGSPSGHTAFAFAIATVIILMTKNKILQFFVLPAAVLVGFSRMYLAQHLLEDVLAGAFIGTVSAIPAVYLAVNIKSIKVAFRKLHWFQKNNIQQRTVIQPS